MDASPNRDDLAAQYLDQLPYEPYPVQEEALLAWFTSEQGVLVCAPTGTGKTLIAQAALFEALHTGKVAYYTTPLIALTDQKFQEMQAAAVRWGFRADDVGLVTGNRKVNPDAKVLVVVAEILLNRLLHESEFEFNDVASVVMDEFHSFNDPERGIVWELSLGLLPKHVRLMLLSATVGNTREFMEWLQRSHGRRLDLVQGTERKVPLRYHWVGDELLNEQIEFMARGDDTNRKMPTLVFCFNRDECWSVAEQLRGRDILTDGQQKAVIQEINRHDWSQGIGPKLKTLLMRGVGVHHAGVLPKYKRIVEDLFVKKLLSVCVCTETLSAGMNLPARSVLMTSLLKGPPGNRKLIDPSIAHQIFGRAGRPQFDTEGHVYALAHEDDVRIERFKEKLNQIPEDTKDPLLIRKRKELKKKAPTRRKGEQYWSEEQFTKLIEAPPTQLKSQGPFPWRLLGYMLSLSSEVTRVRTAITKRLMDPKLAQAAQRRLIDMLLTLEDAGLVILHPEPPPELKYGTTDGTTVSAERPKSLKERLRELAAEQRYESEKPWSGEYQDPYAAEASGEEYVEDEFGAGLDSVPAPAPSSSSSKPAEIASPAAEVAHVAYVVEMEAPTEVAEDSVETTPEVAVEAAADVSNAPPPELKLTSSLRFLLEKQGVRVEKSDTSKAGAARLIRSDQPDEIVYEPTYAYPTETLPSLLGFRSINPLFGMFLLDILPLCDGPERVQALESVLEFPGSLVRPLRIPKAEFMPPSRFTMEFLNPELLQRGLASQTELSVGLAPDQQELPPEERIWPLTFPEKLQRLFRSEFPHVNDIPMTPVWAAGEVLHIGNFNTLVTSRKIAKQEGIVFRHVLRFVLLCEEFLEQVPAGTPWHEELRAISDRLAEACRAVDPYSTDQMIESAKAADLVER